MQKKKGPSRFETVALHGGYNVEQMTMSTAVPLYRTTSYNFRSSQHAQDLFALKDGGFIYTRLGSPTQQVLEERMSLLEGGAAALALASGTNAIFYTIINICSHGDEIASSVNLYGGTYSMFNDIIKQFKIKVNFFDPDEPGSLDRALTPKTRLVYAETIGNPTLDVADLEMLASTAHARGLPLVVDSTFTPPCLLRPIEHGTDIVIHSLTKWIGGHGTAIGGIVIDAGTFDWKDPKFSLYSDPDTGYHGLRFAHDLDEFNRIAFIMRMRLVPLRNLGGCISPDNSWIFLQGIETLSLRMERHCSNALAVARYLKDHPKVSWIRYPGLAGDPGHDVAARYLQNGFGGMVVFGVRGGVEEGKRFIEGLNLFSHLANVGDAKSLAIHPASTTHSQLSPDEQSRAGLALDLVRLSIGIEHIDDIIADIDQSFRGI